MPYTDPKGIRRVSRAGRRARLPDDPQVVKALWNVYLLLMRVTLNGDLHNLRDGATVDELITQLGLNQRRIAVEVNRDILPCGAYTARALHEGDVVEIVNFVGGG